MRTANELAVAESNYDSNEESDQEYKENEEYEEHRGFGETPGVPRVPRIPSVIPKTEASRKVRAFLPHSRGSPLPAAGPLGVV